MVQLKKYSTITLWIPSTMDVPADARHKRLTIWNISLFWGLSSSRNNNWHWEFPCATRIFAEWECFSCDSITCPINLQSCQGTYLYAWNCSTQFVEWPTRVHKNRYNHCSRPCKVFYLCKTRNIIFWQPHKFVQHSFNWPNVYNSC